jgi:GH25 family lysozyme M1 (1,4-beta-N-acetylmuramidase)
VLILTLAAACAPERQAVTRRAPAGTRDRDAPAIDSGDADTGVDTGTGEGDADVDADVDADSDADADPGEPGPLLGVDVSHWQGDVDWARAYADGVRFAWAKATEGTYYEDDQFARNLADAGAAGIVRGGYHFANPSYSGGAEQAAFFLDHGGDWAPDGLTLPGVLDFEWNPYDGDDCYDMSESELRAWIEAFDDAYVRGTGRHVAIYTSATYWNYCVGDDSFGEILPLWVADWRSGPPALPTGWSAYVAWQFSAEGTVAGIDGSCDVNRFEGGTRDLEEFADGG